MNPAPSATGADERRAKTHAAAQPAPPRWSLPSRTTINFVLDSVLLVVFTVLMGITAIVRFVFPTAAAAAGWSLWGGTLDDWLAWQFGVVATLTMLVVLHLMLHWTWVCGVVANRLSQSGRPTIRFDDGHAHFWASACWSSCSIWSAWRSPSPC